MIRRSLLVLSVLGPWSGVEAAPRRSLADPMRLGVEQALWESGLIGRLLQGFARYGGLKVEPVPGTSAQVLASLEQGEVDAALTDAPELETQLEKQGLAHDRRPVASGDLVLVGPAVRGRSGDPSRLPAGRDIVAALAAAPQAKARFFSAPEGSGAYLAELGLWREAQVAPLAPWYVKTPPGEDALGLAVAQGGYTLVERGRWLARPRKPLGIVVEGDPRMAVAVHVMRSFRVSHPAAALFVKWISGPQGASAVQAAPGWRALRS